MARENKGNTKMSYLFIDAVCTISRSYKGRKLYFPATVLYANNAALVKHASRVVTIYLRKCRMKCCSLFLCRVARMLFKVALVCGRHDFEPRSSFIL